MLTTGIAPDVGAYNFKSSPDSSSMDDSFMPDYLDLHSDDFLQTLSSDLDIPLLLNSNDELGLLNSFLDRSPDEILSEVTPPGALLSNGNLSDLHFDVVNQWSPSSLKAEVKSELLSSGSPTPSQTSTGSQASDVKEELIIDTPPVSPNDSFTRLKTKVPLRKAASPYVVPVSGRSRKSCAEIPSPKRPKILKPSSIMPKTTSSDSRPSVVVIEAIPTSVPQITITNNVPTYIPMPVSVGVSVNMDPKVLKRQQRMIKNRESANLSRKKKKEYLTSLEKQVQDLMSENNVLRIENAQLKERLARTCGNKISLFPVNLPSKTVAKTMVLCVFLLTMGFNLDYLRGPLYSRESFAKSPADSVSKISNHHSRSLLWTPENEGISTANTTEGAQLLPMCPIYVNQSENVRLAEELHRWIGKPFNMSEEFYKENPITERPVKIKKSRSRSKARQNSLDTPILSSVYRLGKRARRVELISDNELQVYTPNIDHIYSEFFEAINRRDDTFYVVSFSPDHMLLPALHYNKTTRPKMSLIMPFMLPNDSAHSQSTAMPLMQIDCEVLDTRLIHVKYGAIPEHLRTQGNHTTETSYKHTGRNVTRPDSKSRNITSESYKPYFMQKRKAKPLLYKSEFDDRR